ncbi:HVO_A0114 family putative DNA-binding protein [Acidisoma sp. 7E03]
MSKQTKIDVIVGGSLEEDLKAFADTWTRAAAGAAVVPRRVLAFESWDGLAKVVTPERYRLLRHLHGHPEPSISSLARSLQRQYRRVHDDVTALEDAGLIARSTEGVTMTADRISTEIRF